MWSINHSDVTVTRSMADARGVRRRASLAMVAGLFALLIGFSGTGVANAGAYYETQIPESSGTIERGYWHGAWQVTTTNSEVHIYSLQDTEFCEASQNGSRNWTRTSSRQWCRANKQGGKSVAGDYVKYGLEN
ncbi:hypothetical protein CLV65_0042 [Pseudoscardovia suis]|uniref:Uncharacterized protein n=1 Tax=Pseudoscardovia suis TaxID=987063 RepID=A0A261EYY0_9BIFI|nr:hypothetical protein PSSU_0840 [Pseudoscardovia suis]PJJ69345.1 hypothetical protein CLV65_0042 [Pseudoscardovia suis]